MPDWAFHYAGYAVAIIAAVGVLLALFRDRAKGRARCRKCWYDLAGAGDLPIHCPECGKSHTKPRHLKKTRRHKRLALVWLLVMVVGGYGLWVVPRVQERGWTGSIPTFVLAGVAPWINAQMAIDSEIYGEVRRELRDRLVEYYKRDNGDGYLIGLYWNICGVPIREELPQTNSDLSIAEPFYRLFLLRRGAAPYEAVQTCIELELLGPYGTYGIYLGGFIKDDVGAIQYRAEMIYKDRSYSPWIIYITDDQTISRPALPYSQSYTRSGGKTSVSVSEHLVLTNKNGSFGPLWVWLESPRGDVFGPYEITWEFLYEPKGAGSFEYLSIRRWRRLPD